MSKHSDAIGYLRELSKDLDLQWFNLICDHSIEKASADFTAEDTDLLKVLYTDLASYLPSKSVTPTADENQSVQGVFLESLSGFLNFKRLSGAFDLNFSQQVTLIFGHNGSGKSSICDAFKILANHEPPSRPIHNVRITGVQKVQFSYMFQNASSRQWSESVGFGSEHSKIKYFDSSVAQKSIRDNIEPGSIVELSPFNMKVFESAKAKTAKVKDVLQHARDEIVQILEFELKQLRSRFSDFPKTLIHQLDDSNLQQLSELIESAVSFSEHELLKSYQLKHSELKKASSDDGQKAIALEIKNHEELLAIIENALRTFIRISEIDPERKAAELKMKLEEQVLLHQELLPKKGTFEDFVTFLSASKAICDLNPTTAACPLCHRTNGPEEKTLFQKYFDLLHGQLEKEIISIKETMEVSRVLIKKLRSQKVDIKSFETIQPDQIISIVTLLSVLQSESAIANATEVTATLAELKNIKFALEKSLRSKINTIESVRTGLSEVQKMQTELEMAIKSLNYLATANSNLESLQSVSKLLKQKKYWDQKLPTFTPILKKLTDTEKHAYQELVVSDFHKRLEAEYLSLAEKHISAFGVELTKKGTTSGVTVLAKAGGKEISKVLSEGEQRLHSLALFFAELETSRHSVIVFDDPISSFDYDYISNYCSRVRDFAARHPKRQIIVLTHNWEFFVNLQLVLNGHSELHNRLSVQVLESCTSISSYSEKIVELKSQITSVLNQSTEPTKSEKEILAGRMRRLIESVINTHVFNDERHQFKHKNSGGISKFQKFTKLVPLLDSEAQELKDLFSKLSTSEHDDPRNAYVNTDKLVFQTRYNRIVSIETDIVARK